MEKRELYDVSDEEFAYFLNAAHGELGRENMPYIFVGGTAVQLQCAKRLCDIHGVDISTLASEPKLQSKDVLRLQDHIRATDDVDLALASSVYEQGSSSPTQESNGTVSERDVLFYNRVGRVLDGLQREAISPSEEHILDYRIHRRGVKRPVFQVYVDGEGGDEQLIAMNLSRQPSDLKSLEDVHYDEFVERGETLAIPYNPDFNINARVISPTDLLAAKTAKFRAKDTMDLHSLADLMRANGEEVDVEGMRRILGPEYEHNLQRFISIMNAEHQ